MDVDYVPSCLRGHHIYKKIWTPTIGEELLCQREPTNMTDRYAVSITKGSTVVGHLPNKISIVSSLFIRCGGSITCKITGKRRTSVDLPQKGLEVPCMLMLKGKKKELSKLKSLIND
jgi:hypothetical protein